MRILTRLLGGHMRTRIDNYGRKIVNPKTAAVTNEAFRPPPDYETDRALFTANTPLGQAGVARYKERSVKANKVFFMLLTALSLALSACTRQQEISGEIFTLNSKNGIRSIIKESGTVIHFLSTQEHERFEVLLKEWRTKEYKEDRELAENW